MSTNVVRQFIASVVLSALIGGTAGMNIGEHLAEKASADLLQTKQELQLSTDLNQCLFDLTGQRVIIDRQRAIIQQCVVDITKRDQMMQQLQFKKS